MANIQFVDENDNPIGAGTKQEAIEKGIAHRTGLPLQFERRSPHTET